MDYETLESAVSKPRAERYLRICKGNKAAAVDLYLFNIRHSQYFYPLLSMFEVVLRNSINTHYSKQLNDGDWLNSSIKQNGIFTNEVFRTGGFETKMQIQKAKRTLTKPYTHDRLVSKKPFQIPMRIKRLQKQNCTLRTNLFQQEKWNRSFIFKFSISIVTNSDLLAGF